MKKLFYELKNDRFIFRTFILSVVMTLLFCWKGYNEGVTVGGMAVIIYAVTYSIIFIIFRRRFFFLLQLIYSVILIFIESVYDTQFCSNFTAFFCVIMAILYRRKYINVALSLYFIFSLIAFLYMNENLYDVGLHYVRCLWILEVVFDFHKNNFKERRPELILDETDREILEQLSKGAQQKEIEGLSENTVSKRLKKMRERNFCATNAELIIRYLEEE